MNRRGFLASLLGLAAAPVIAKLEPFVGPPLSDQIGWVESAAGEWTVIDYRARALAALRVWFSDTQDRMMYEAITNEEFYLEPT